MKIKRSRLLAGFLKKPPGTAPGTLPEQPSQDFYPTTAQLIRYDDAQLKETDYETDAALSEEMPQDLRQGKDKNDVEWLNVDGLQNIDVIKQISAHYGLNYLAMEDVFNMHHRPKAEVIDDTLFLIMRMPILRGDELDNEQVSFFLKKGQLVTFQEQPGDCFGPVRDRLRNGGKRIRFLNSDYLAYTLIDSIVDGVFPVLDYFDEQLVSLEECVMETPEKDVLKDVYQMKRSLRSLRQSIWPMREVLQAILYEKLDTNEKFFSDSTQPYLRDCYDHLVQIIDILETMQERSSSLIDLYMSSVSNRMNEVMKVLTIIATIFIPLGFIAGLYGMNFDPAVSPYNMPELSWYYGYPFAIGLMLVLAIGLIIYFWKKGWLGKS